MSAPTPPSNPGSSPEWVASMLSALATATQASTDPQLTLTLVVIMFLLMCVLQDE